MAQSKTLKSKLRSLLMEMFEMRGDHYSNLWFFYSHKTGRDWCVASDPEFIHALTLEGDKDVKSFDLHPAEILAPTTDGDGMSKLDAIVRMHSGAIEGREIKASGVIQPGSREERQHEIQAVGTPLAAMTYRRITLAELMARQIFWVNWFRICAWLAAVRSYEMREYRARTALRLAQIKGPTPLEEALHGAPYEEEPFYRAALFMLVQEGLYDTDLETAPLSYRTLITPREVSR